MHQVLSSQLSTLGSEFDAATARVVAMQRTFSEDQWQRKPGPERWSAIECVEHLNRSHEEMLPRIRAAMATLPKRSSTSSEFKLDLFGWMLVKSLLRTGRFARYKTTASFIPARGLNTPLVLEQFHSLQQSIIQALRDAEGLALNAGKVTSAFNSVVKYNVYSAFRVLAVHEQRHLDQAKRAAELT